MTRESVLQKTHKNAQCVTKPKRLKKGFISESKRESNKKCVTKRVTKINVSLVLVPKLTFPIIKVSKHVRALGAFGASVLFGFADPLQMRLQALGLLPPQIVLTIPYVLTIVVLVGVVRKARPPSDYKPYVKE